jgi:hypothetical protein
LSLRGRVPSPPGAQHPWKVPFSPLVRPVSTQNSKTGQGDLGMPPAVARVTLTEGRLLAMIKRPCEQPVEQFSNKCCLNNTRFTPLIYADT